MSFGERRYLRAPLVRRYSWHPEDLARSEIPSYVLANAYGYGQNQDRLVYAYQKPFMSRARAQASSSAGSGNFFVRVVDTEREIPAFFDKLRVVIYYRALTEFPFYFTLNVSNGSDTNIKTVNVVLDDLETSATGVSVGNDFIDLYRAEFDLDIKETAGSFCTVRLDVGEDDENTIKIDVRSVVIFGLVENDNTYLAPEEFLPGGFIDGEMLREVNTRINEAILGTHNQLLTIKGFTNEGARYLDSTPLAGLDNCIAKALIYVPPGVSELNLRSGILFETASTADVEVEIYKDGVLITSETMTDGAPATASINQTGWLNIEVYGEATGGTAFLEKVEIEVPPPSTLLPPP